MLNLLSSGLVFVLLTLAGATQAADCGTATGGMAAPAPALVPPPDKALRTAIDDYRAIAKAGGWQAVPPGLKLETGAQGLRVLALARRLSMTGDLARAQYQSGAPSDRFDESLAAAVKHFQQRHGLAVDGVVGPATLRELNVPVAARIETLALNLPRIEREQAAWGDRYLMVNAASATYRLVDGGQILFDRPAIVGRATWQTPQLDGVIERLDFNPYWTVPPRIANLEIFPIIRREQNYLARHHMHFVNGQIRQDPGPDNPLGVVKFFFENPYNVYLHDTNNRTLFARPERFFSHGCVRIAEPLDLARYLLAGDPAWPEGRIDEVVASGGNLQVHLRTGLPVHIVYRTSWVDADGTVQFRRDVYGRDHGEGSAPRSAEP